jgi:predicted RNA binding protein YcfA (HicA-like mRNA interferase family)
VVEGFYDAVTEILSANGWSRVPGGKGSHEKWRGPDGRILIVPHSKSRHTANSVLTQAGVAKRL